MKYLELVLSSAYINNLASKFSFVQGPLNMTFQVCLGIWICMYFSALHKLKLYVVYTL